MEDWNQLPLVVPNNNDVVWCRTSRWSGAPFLGQWKSAQQSFTDTTNSLDYPVWAVTYWKPQ